MFINKDSMADDWIIQGSRPPSVADNRPRSATGKQFGYHVINSTPSVDETLFRSFYNGRQTESMNFEAPWNKTNKFNEKIIIAEKKKPEKNPLLWCPSSDKSCQKYNILKKGSGFRSEIFRKKKHTPTFCDETLFGKTDFTEPNFEAPWNYPIRKNIIFRDMNGNTVNVNNNNNNNNVNWRRLKIRTRPSTAPSQRPGSNNPRPLWKP